MLPNHHDAVPQRDELVGIGRYGRVERGVPERHARRRRHDPSDVLAVAIPLLYTERQVGRDVRQVGISQLAKQAVNALVELRRCAPKVAALSPKPFESAELWSWLSLDSRNEE